MCRQNRNKSPESVHHIMCRSISEINLFRDDYDKCKYLKTLKIYCEKFGAKVYSFCVMDTHVHFQLDPCGCDISKLMHGLNLSYVQYYNKKYDRHGHLFQDRFLNKVVRNDAYNITLSAYIHNNPKDLADYTNKLHLYPFSSYGIYLGFLKDTFDLIDSSFILNYFATKENHDDAVINYTKFVLEFGNHNQKELNDKIIAALRCKNMYRSERTILYRDLNPQFIINTITKSLKFSNINFFRIKYIHKYTAARSFFIFSLKYFCDMSNKNICEFIGNISFSEITKLSKNGLELIKHSRLYLNMFFSILHTNITINN